jgi:hypothetical protein
VRLDPRRTMRDYREEGHRLWERFTQKTAREQLWYYGGLLAFFERRRPGTPDGSSLARRWGAGVARRPRRRAAPTAAAGVAGS